MKLLDDNLFEELEDDTEAPDESAEQDKDILKRLEKMVEEVGDEADSID